jgi:hypothetical protein
MAERNLKHSLRCQNQYQHDRLSSQKMSQVYHWLVPEEPVREPAATLTIAQHEKDRSHLRSSFL